MRRLPAATPATRPTATRRRASAVDSVYPTAPSSAITPSWNAKLSLDTTRSSVTARSVPLVASTPNDAAAPRLIRAHGTKSAVAISANPAATRANAPRRGTDRHNRGSRRPARSTLPHSTVSTAAS